MGLENVLRRLKDGEFDGGYSDREGNNGTLTILQIHDGFGERIYHGKTIKTFDGKENSKSNYTETTEFKTDDELRDFILRYGYLADLFKYDEEARKV
ncbi:MAG: hypothetical protein IKE81_11880, partial [Clostridia bacterium]|nr:hypothetical protein [Clostridia bacterium]